MSEYGYVITYEDPQYAYAGDLQDATAQVRRDLDKYAPGKAPRVMGPLGGKLTLNVPSISSSQDMASVLSQLVQSYRDRGGHFRVQQTAGAFHVIPAEVRDVNGNWAANLSVLDNSISISPEERTEYGMIDAICTAVSQVAHVNVKVGIGAGQGIAGEGDAPRYHLEASNEPARSVLLRALAAANGGRRTWMLLYDFGGKTYFLSILAVPDLSPMPQQVKIAPQPPGRPVLSGADAGP